MSVLSDTEFGLSVFSQFPSDESVVFSPASLSLSLALIHAGANGKTKKEIRKALVGGDSSSENLRSFYKSLAASLSEKSECLLKLAIRLYLRYGLIDNSYRESKEAFKVAKNFEASIEAYCRFSNILDFASDFNWFISEATEGKITCCMDPRCSSFSDLKSLNRITSVLVNTIYFEGKWKDQFYSNDVRESDFHVKEGLTKKVEFMEQSEVKRLYAATDEVEVLTLPYQDEKYTFTIILPKDRFTLGTVRAGLTGKKLQELLQSVKETCIDISIPKFKIDMETDATKILKALGVERAFSEGAELKTYAKNLWINMIHHNAIIEINESGTRPGNVAFNEESGSRTTEIKERVKFIADHPFLFFICREDKIIFSGQYIGPRRILGEPELYEPVDLNSNTFIYNKISDKQFGLSFLRHLPSDESAVFSPTSIAFALALVHAGATENVKSEIRRVLLGDVSDEQFVNYFRFMYASLREKSRALVRIANRMFVRDGFDVTNSYMNNIAKNFAAEAQNLDFNNSEDASKRINEFVDKMTVGMIPNCIGPNDFNSETNVIMTNAIYFEGTWARRFINYGATFTFHVKEGIDKEVGSLYDFEVHELYGATEEAEILTLAYTDEKYTFTIILPKKLFGLAELRDSLTDKKLEELFKSVEISHIFMEFPKFIVETEPDTTKILKNLGVSTMFSKEEANLEGIAPNVWISEVNHKAIIDVNENGTRAAGITWHPACGYAGTDEPIKAKFKADHPFLYFIRREENILFAGQFYG